MMMVKIRFRGKLLIALLILISLFWLAGLISPWLRQVARQDSAVSFTQVGSIPVREDQGMGPTFFSLSSDGSAAYVLVPRRNCQKPGQESETSLVARLDLKTQQVTGTIELAQHVLGAALSPDGKYLFVTNSYDDRVSIIDLDQWEIVQALAVGPQPTQDRATSCVTGYNYKPQFIVFSHDGRFAYTSNSKGNFISVIDVQKQELTAQIPVSSTVAGGQERRVILWGIAAHPSRDLIFVGTKNEGRILVIDTKTQQVLRQIQAGVGEEMAPLGLAVGLSGDVLYVANSVDKSVWLISTHTWERIGKISLDDFAPRWITLDKTEQLAFVTTVQTNTVFVLDLQHQEVSGQFEASGFPFLAQPSQDGQRVYLTPIEGSDVLVYERR